MSEDDLKRLIANIERAITILNGLEGEYEQREQRLRHPFKDRLQRHPAESADESP